AHLRKKALKCSWTTLLNSLASLTPTSSNGEKRNVIETRLTYNVNRCPYCKSEKVVRNGSKICTCALRSFTRNALK
ncbi:hypothetical protein, partial [Ligilactobacillus ruminis]|uniref:hypothetical protein n=1 Tax=Ligilactobacillus ruminis TaxID=1623 RepID=UPI001C0214D1